MRKTNRAPEAVYNKSERDEILERMDGITKRFYGEAVATRCHPFIEFCGLMSEHVTLCRAASKQDVDFTQANTHSGQALPMQAFNAAYIGEKMGCIYGPSLSDPKLFRAFIAAMDLSFEVEIKPKTKGIAAE